MKKIIIILGLLVIGTSIMAQDTQYTYTPAYIQHLKVCSVYTDEYITNIPTKDVNSPYLKVKSTEEILGNLNGKCYTKSTIYSYDLGKDILKIKCGIPATKINDIVEKMKKVNEEESTEAKKSLQDELTKLIENKDICRVKNYLEEEEE